MRRFRRSFSVTFAAALAAVPLACSDDDGAREAAGAGGSSEDDGDGAEAGESPGDSPSALDPQTPPHSATEMVDWLAAFEANEWSKDWVCEAEFTEKTDGAAAIHAHGANRVCNNRALAAATPNADNELPVGAAALKYVDRGIYVEVKVQAESDGGRGWYWYAPGGTPAGLGLTTCTGCHSAAGSDAEHPGLGDYVYFQVRN